MELAKRLTFSGNHSLTLQDVTSELGSAFGLDDEGVLERIPWLKEHGEGRMYKFKKAPKAVVIEPEEEIVLLTCTGQNPETLIIKMSTSGIEVMTLTQFTDELRSTCDDATFREIMMQFVIG